MFRFWNKEKRRAFFERSRFRKYLIYATGEILLVVIGILIALKVNNYNVDQLNKEKFDKIFSEVKLNLQEDIIGAQNTISYYNRKDSLIGLVVSDQTTEEMFSSNSELFYLLYYYQSFTLTDNGYNLLDQNLDLIPEKYRECMPYLHRIYKGYRPLFESINQYIIDFTYRMLERWSLDQAYFTRSREEKIDFFMNSDAFKNDAILYGRYSQDSFVRNLHTYLFNSITALNMLQELELGDDYDMVDYYREHLGYLDTIYLTASIPTDVVALDPKLVEKYPIYKKTADRTNLFLRNHLQSPVRLKKSVQDILITEELDAEGTAYSRPIVGSSYDVVTENGQILGSFVVPSSNSVLIIDLDPALR